jgi:hypothetical protein
MSLSLRPSSRLLTLHLDLSKDESLYTHFLDNRQTTDHRSIIFGVRQLNASEVALWCTHRSVPADPPRWDEPFRFTHNYELRLYTSGCFYLDDEHRWRSDGLQVGPLTNLTHTQCLSSHLTTFAAGFAVLSQPIGSNHAFADSTDHEMIHLTVILCLMMLMIFARSLLHPWPKYKSE